MPHECALRESGSVAVQVLVPPLVLAGKELGAITAIDWQSARALGGNQRAAGQQWGRSTVWSPHVPPPLMAAVWRLRLHGLVALLCSLAINIAGVGARASFRAMGADVRGRARRQDRLAGRHQFRLIRDAPTGQSAAWCARVETRPCGWAATGVVREAVETEGMVCSRRLDPAWPHEGTECARLAVGLTDGQSRVRPVCVYFLWLPAGEVQGRALFPMHPEHITMVSVHSSDRYMV